MLKQRGKKKERGKPKRAKDKYKKNTHAIK